jgi:hypothetical protein
LHELTCGLTTLIQIGMVPNHSRAGCAWRIDMLQNVFRIDWGGMEKCLTSFVPFQCIKKVVGHPKSVQLRRGMGLLNSGQPYKSLGYLLMWQYKWCI